MPGTWGKARSKRPVRPPPPRKRKCSRVTNLLGRLKASAVEGDARAMIEDIIAIHRTGKFQQRVALFHFLRDLVHSLRLRDGAQGKRSKGMRWHTSTKRIFATLRTYGGPKTTRFLHETLEARRNECARLASFCARPSH